MNPTDDELDEIEPPMTRASFDSEVLDPGPETEVDPDGTLDGGSRPGGSSFDRDLSGLLPPDSPSLGSLTPGSWSNGGSNGGGSVRRGIVGKIEPGQVLYGKYLVLRRIGNGAMGEVWLVRHVTLKSEHALKVIIPNFASNAVALMRFQRELEVMATLRQEHAVTIYDAFIDEDGGYIDMEYLDGQTLHEAVNAVRSRVDHDPTEPLMPLDWVVRILDQLCEVLQVAHAKGIVHRDLKPSNMMLLNGRKPGKESLKVLDFGIAKIRDDPESAAGRDLEAGANKTQGFIGTPSYASPEQAMASDDIDGRSDLYSVGIMLYEFITGRLPFRGNQWQVMSQNAHAAPPPFAETNPKLRPLPELEHAVLRILSKEPADRPSTGLELFDLIRDAVEAVLPVGSPGLTPPTWDAVPYFAPSVLPSTQHAIRPDNPAISTQAPTLVARDSQPGTLTADPMGEPGPVVAPRPTGRGVAIAAILGVSIIAAILVGAIVMINQSAIVPGTNSPPGKVPEVVTPKSFERYWPSTYLAVDKPGDDPASPEKVRRTTDEVFFHRFAPGIYLPEGYQAEKPDDLVDGWPRVIVRDGVRFLRIEGGREWVMGDPDAQLNAERADVPAHSVILSGFYIQETEVTNGQFEDYLKRTQTVKPGDWNRVVTELKAKVGAEEAGQHPAVCISRKTAQLYADFMDGQLPTEAQWEFAARSQGDKRRYVWGNMPGPNPDLANIDTNSTRTTVPVRSYPADKTAQGLFDMTGNVQEMCRDRWEPYQKTLNAVVDPCATPGGGDEAVEFAIRGAAFTSYGAACAITRRDDHRPSSELAENLGFRLVVECPDARKPR